MYTRGKTKLNPDATARDSCAFRSMAKGRCEPLWVHRAPLTEEKPGIDHRVSLPISSAPDRSRSVLVHFNEVMSILGLSVTVNINLTGDDHHICLLGPCLFRTYVPCDPSFIVSTPSYHRWVMSHSMKKLIEWKRRTEYSPSKVSITGSRAPFWNITS